MLPDALPLTPFRQPVRGEVVLPGSKSITNRALMLAALADRSVRLDGALFSEDTNLMAAALRRLGFGVSEDRSASTMTVEGHGGVIPADQADLPVGLAGTAARFLTALCAAAPRGRYRIDGTPQMRRRPMRPLIEALRTLGAGIRCPGVEGFLPLEISARGLHGGNVTLDASESSQLLSALLLVAPLASSEVALTLRGKVREGYVAMTLRMMEQFSATGDRLVEQKSPSQFHIRSHPRPYRPAAGDYAVEPDASSASYFLALPLVTRGRLLLRGARDAGIGLQADTAFADVVRGVGATVAARDDGLEVAFSGATRAGLDRDFHPMSDTFMTLAAIAPLLEGSTRLRGIAHTRRQETDRVAGMAAELRKLGQEVHEEEDSLTITPRPLLPDQTVDPHSDHRFAMSFGILGCHDLRGDGRPWLTLRDPGCCAKTFPGFFELLESLRQKSSGG